MALRPLQSICPGYLCALADLLQTVYLHRLSSFVIVAGKRRLTLGDAWEGRYSRDGDRIGLG